MTQHENQLTPRDERIWQFHQQRKLEEQRKDDSK
jgi:hypothetical protein